MCGVDKGDMSFSFVFFFNDTATTEIYTLSLHDALPILDQHRAMTRRQNEPVAVGPMGGRCVEFQMFFKQNRGDVGHAHGHSGMAGIRGVNGIQRQRTYSGGFGPVIGVRSAQGRDIHGVWRPLE